MTQSLTVLLVTGCAAFRVRRASREETLRAHCQSQEHSKITIILMIV